MSDKASYCHHCGVVLAPESAAGDDTAFTCPACGVEHHMISRRIGEVTALECDRCTGLWLGNEVFEQLTKQASSDAGDIDELLVPPGAGRLPPNSAIGPTRPKRNGGDIATASFAAR